MKLKTKEKYMGSIISLVIIIILGTFANNALNEEQSENLPATPEQLKEIARETPCAIELFRERLNSRANGYSVLSFRVAKSMALHCARSERQVAIKKEKEKENKKIHEMQMDALSEID